MTSPAQFGPTYLYTGKVKTDTTGKKLVPEDGSLSPARNLVLLGEMSMKPSGGGAPSGRTVAWLSGPEGLLRPMSGTTGDVRKAAVRYYDDGAHVRLMPHDVVLGAWAKAGEKWPQELSRVPGPSIAIREMDVRKKHLRPPDRASDDPEEKEYASAYDKMSEKAPPNAGLVLPRVRSVVLTFTDASTSPRAVALTPVDGGSKIAAAKSGKSSSWVAFGTEDTLRAGLYKIEVTLEKGARQGNPDFVKGTYTLHEFLRFEITNPFGDVDLVSIDPISVEEALMAQFPLLFEHLTKAAAKRAHFPEQEVEAHKYPAALKPYAERLKWVHAKAKLTVKMANAGSASKLAKIIGKTIYDAIDPKGDVGLERLKAAVDFGFGVKEAYEGLEDFLKQVENRDALKGIRRLLASDDQLKLFEKYRWWKYASSKLLDDKVMVFDLMDVAKNETVLKAGIPPERTRLQRKLGSGGKAVEKSIAVVGTALDVINVAVAFNELWAAKESADKMQSELKRLAGDADKVMKRGASREALGNLERMRTAAVAARLGAEQAEGEALMAALDLALGVLSMVGIGGPALALLAFVRAAGGLCVDAAEAFDRYVLEGLVADAWARQMQVYELARASRANQELLPSRVEKGGVDDLYTQFILRAEALTGLVRLLMRAAMNAESTDEYLANVKAMGVEQYVENVVLGSGWQFPLHSAIPMGMDSTWLQQQHHTKAALDTTSLADVLGYTRILDLSRIPLVPGCPVPLAVAKQLFPGSANANYHASFPLHRFESPKFEDLAFAFRPSWNELKEESIAYSCIYWRPRGAADKDPWRRVYSPSARSPSQLPLLSPFDQLRVLLVMKEKAVSGGQYPVKFRIVRCDGINVDGPEYDEIMRPLTKKELLPDEQEYEGKVGFVLYPTYCFGPQAIPGVKPLVSTYWRAGDMPTHLDDMRYCVKVLFGKNTRGPDLDLGAGSGKKAGMDEFRLGFSGKPDENKLLNVSFLSRQGKDVKCARIFNAREFEHSGAAPVYGRVGDKSKWELATYKETKGDKVFRHFNWRDPVEFVVVVWSTWVPFAEAEAEQIEWDRINVKMKLVNFVGVDEDGPEYDSSLQYVGMLTRSAFDLSQERSPPTFQREFIEAADPRFYTRRSHPVRGAGTEVTEWANQVLNDPKELHKLAWAIDPEGTCRPKRKTFYIFAAHFRLDYYLPDSTERVESLRPFGDVLTNRSPVPAEGDEYYRIGIQDFHTTGNEGLRCKEILAIGHSDAASGKDDGLYYNHRPEYEFHFRAPYVGMPVPWSACADVDTWITKDATLRFPKVEIAVKPAPKPKG